MRVNIRRELLGMCAAIVGCAAMASPAAASFGLKSFTVSFDEAPLAGAPAEALGLPDLQAGSHPYGLTTSLKLNTTTNSKGNTIPEGALKDLQVNLPAGVIGNARAIPTCPTAVFAAGALGGTACPADTLIGVLTIETTNLGTPSAFLINLPAPSGDAAQFGVVEITPGIMNVKLRTGDDGLTVDLHDVEQTLPLLGMSITIWGVPADPRHDVTNVPGGTKQRGPSGTPLNPLLTMPTSCTEPLITTAVADSWENEHTEVAVTPGGSGHVPSSLSGCDRLRFDPTIAVQPESSAAATPAGLAIDVGISHDSEHEGLVETSLRNTAIALPAGLSINPAAAAGLTGCSPAQIALGEATKPTCPETSEIGAFEVQTPLLPAALQGSIYLAQPAAGLFSGALTVYLAGEESELQFKIPGQLTAQPGNGQLTLTLENTPELPLTDLKLDLFSGPRGMLAAPPTCGTFTSTAELTPYSAPESGPPAARSSSFTIGSACGGGFAPSFQAGGTSSKAGQGTGFALEVGSADGQQHPQSLTVTLPPGLLASVGSVAQCGDAEAAAGTCPAASEIGTVSVGAGAGPDPNYLNGVVYLTGPYGGAPFGLSMVIPGLAGPFNLGTTIVRGGVTVNLATATLTIATDPFPVILQGIPLRIKNVELAIDRSGFMVNPTTCAGQTITGAVGSTAGTSAAVSAPFGVIGCAGLPFAPQLAAATQAQASSRGHGASLDVKITNAPGAHANLGSQVIELPRALKPRLSAIQEACPAATFAANPGACPPASVVGKAVVDTPMLGTPLTGPVYAVFARGTKYPKLVEVLQGSGLSLQVTGTVSVDKGISRTVFSSLPDMPMSLFELSLPEGSHSLLGATKSLCAGRRSMHYTMVGQNRAQSEGSVGLSVEGCPHTASVNKGTHVASASKRTGKASASRHSRAKMS